MDYIEYQFDKDMNMFDKWAQIPHFQARREYFNNSGHAYYNLCLKYYKKNIIL